MRWGPKKDFLSGVPRLRAISLGRKEGKKTREQTKDEHWRVSGPRTRVTQKKKKVEERGAGALYGLRGTCSTSTKQGRKGKRCGGKEGKELKTPAVPWGEGPDGKGREDPENTITVKRGVF